MRRQSDGAWRWPNPPAGGYCLSPETTLSLKRLTKMINASRVAAIIFILFGVLFYYITRDYPPDAAFFPGTLLLGIVILSVALIVRSFHFDPYKLNLCINQKMQLAIGALLGIAYIASMYYIGYYAASAIFILLFAAFLRFQSKIVPVAVAMAFPLIIYVVFEILLNIPVPGIGL
jgi:hypothetical protein